LAQGRPTEGRPTEQYGNKGVRAALAGLLRLNPTGWDMCSYKQTHPKSEPEARWDDRGERGQGRLHAARPSGTEGIESTIIVTLILTAFASGHHKCVHNTLCHT
jgi:hypothetical protein